jgi:hypothetical protein
MSRPPFFTTQFKDNPFLTQIICKFLMNAPGREYHSLCYKS